MGVKQATPTSAPKEPEGVDEEEWVSGNGGFGMRLW